MGRPAARRADDVVGQDTHTVLVPSPGGVQAVMQPFAFHGALMEQLSECVFIDGKPAAVEGSVVRTLSFHRPEVGEFQRFPSHRGVAIASTTTVFISGKRALRSEDRVMTCNDPDDLPNGKVLAGCSVIVGD